MKHSITITIAPWAGPDVAAVCTCGDSIISDVDSVLEWTNEHSYLQKEAK